MYYFAYGSNFHREQMKNRCPDSVSVARVKLKGYQLTFNRVADIVENKQAITWGAVYKVSPEDIKSLDCYEGYPRLYDKISAVVEDDKGQTYQAFAYVMASKGNREPSNNYYQIIEEGYRNWKLPLNSLQEALKRSHQGGPVCPSKAQWWQ